MGTTNYVSLTHTPTHSHTHTHHHHHLTCDGRRPFNCHACGRAVQQQVSVDQAVDYCWMIPDCEVVVVQNQTKDRRRSLTVKDSLCVMELTVAHVRLPWLTCTLEKEWRAKTLILHRPTPTKWEGCTPWTMCVFLVPLLFLSADVATRRRTFHASPRTQTRVFEG